MGRYKLIESPEKMCYVYAHVNADTMQPFYIGIGKKARYKRAFENKGRNNLWHKIVNKNNCFSTIIYKNLSWVESCEIETNLISYLGRIDKGTGILCNMTDGGEGGHGVIFTEERKRKISESLKGKPTSETHKQKCRLRRQTDYTKNKISKAKTGIKASEETRAKMRITNIKGIKASAEKISKPLIDYNTGVYYDSVRDAAKILGITHGYLSGMLLGRYKNKTKLSYA